MSQVREVDVEQIMRRIREDLRGRKSPQTVGVLERRGSPFDDGQGAVDFAALGSGYDVRDVPFGSHRRILGPLVVTLKKALGKLLTPFLERQAAYNVANMRVTRHTKEWIEELDGQFALVSRQIEALERGRDELPELASRIRLELREVESKLLERVLAEREELLTVQAQARFELRQELLAAQGQALEAMRAQLQPEIDRLRQQAVTAREQVSRAERKLRRILHALADGHAQDRPANAAPAQERPAAVELEPEFDYAGFAERFRGSEADIKDGQRMYLPYFEGRDHVIDVGCGRGEFLELLREKGITGRGLDLDLDMILLCREKGLDVAMEDVFVHLGGLPDDSVGGIFAAQVIEHIPPRRIVELVKLCHRKLASGGRLVVETPNPRCLMVFADSFYKDPSHAQPIHPDAMQFVFEGAGFHEVEVRFSAPVDPALRIPSLHAPGADVGSFNQGLERLNMLLYGFQDYAVIGRKHTR